MIPAGLLDEWKALFQHADEISDKGGADWESLCVGFCMAKGCTVEEAYEFYAKRIMAEDFF